MTKPWVPPSRGWLSALQLQLGGVRLLGFANREASGLGWQGYSSGSCHLRLQGGIWAPQERPLATQWCVP